MTPPRWCLWLLRRLSPENRVDEVLGDLEEAHRRRLDRGGRFSASLKTSFETLDVAFALFRERYRLGVSLLDFKLGFRMLIRNPALTVLGGAALAFAIFVGAGTFEFVLQVVRPTLPLPDGDRIVGVQILDTETLQEDGRVAWDFTRWAEQARTIDNLGAWDSRRRNLIVEEGRGTLIDLAMMSASGFQVAGVAPLHGRWLHPDDQEPGAEPVVVVGFDVWRDRLASDPDVIGRRVRLGSDVTTIVGVMPEGFTFPVAFEGWVPLPANLSGYGPLEGPTLMVVGRLVEGASRQDAEIEFAGLQAAAALEEPATHERLMVEVLPLHRAVFGVPPNMRAFVATVFVGSNIPVLLFLLIVGGNVALLMFARVAAREGEMVVRSALGASRGRIMGQLFIEGLVLTSLAAFVGLALVGFGLRAGFSIVEGELLGRRLPFWFHPTLSTPTIVYTGLLVAIAAAVVGVLPAFKATQGLRGQLQQASAGGGGMTGFGGIWTAVIVAQIAVTCIAPIFTVAVWDESRREFERVDMSIPVEDYIGARLDLDQEEGPDIDVQLAQAQYQERYRETLDEMMAMLGTDPRVAGVAFSQRLPRQYHPWNQVEIEGPSHEPMDERGHRLGRAVVDPDFFRSMDIEIVQGRDFDSGDLEEGERNVIVNQEFVHRILGDRNPIGRRFRYLANESNRDPDQDPGPWHEIVGVVADLGVASGYGAQGVYHPSAPADIQPIHVLAHVPGDAEAFGATLLSTAFSVEPAMRVTNVTTLARIKDAAKEFYRFWFTLLIVITGLALTLSLGTIYAVMSFAVTQRTREIGIRVALGSSRGRIIRSILRHPTRQVAIGVLVGVGGMVGLIYAGGENLKTGDLWLAVVYAMIMMVVCMTACVVPARRVLKLEVRDALGVEG